jgi:hypothetical protein
MRMLPVVNRAAEQAPMVTACCNACRMCAANNVLAVLAGAGTALAALAGRLARRVPRR